MISFAQDEISTVSQSSPPTTSSEVTHIKYAEFVMGLIKKRPSVDDVIIGTREEGKLITSTLPEKEALEKQSNITSLTEKTKVLIRKLLNEEIEHIRIKGTKCEIIVTYDDKLEIIAIQNNLNTK